MKKAIILVILCLCVCLSGCQQTCDHSYSSKTGDDTITYSCEKCDHSYTAQRLSHKHSYGDPVVTKAATCDEDGEQTISCTICDYSYTESIPGDHNWSDATCTTPKICATCGAISGSSLGHTTSDGTCSRCGEYFSLTDDCTLSAVNSIPCIIATYYSSGALWSRVMITGAQYEFTSNYDDTVYLTLDVDMQVMDIDGGYGGCRANLYDAQGNLVDYTHLTEFDLYTGATFTYTADFWYLTPGDYYVEFVPFY